MHGPIFKLMSSHCTISSTILYTLVDKRHLASCQPSLGDPITRAETQLSYYDDVHDISVLGLFPLFARPRRLALASL